MTRMDPRRGAILLLVPVFVFSLTLGLSAREDRQNAAPPASAQEFAGMKAIPAGTFEMGIDAKVLKKMYGDPKKPNRKTHPLLAGKDKAIWWNLIALETPKHKAKTEAYAMDVYTVTNAQYRRFLEEATKGSFLTTQKINTIALVAREVFGGKTENIDAWHQEAIFWLNEKKLLGLWEEIHQANEPKIKAILDAFNQFRPEPAKIVNFLKMPDKQRAEGWVGFLLPAGINLTIYKRGMPDNWEKGVLSKEKESWPVVNVTAEDADAFAEWAGKHVPTEQEWEKAARGPRGFLYPWGDKWHWQKENNRLVWLKADPENPDNPKKGGPASRFLNLPVDVTRIPESVSPYGMFHMLGNVREWTSSLPGLYKGSEANQETWFGKSGYRVLRSTSYGDGRAAEGDGRQIPALELVHRNTARGMHGPGGGIGVGQRFAAVGFRCAKYMQPARDVLMLRQAAMDDLGVFSKDELTENFLPASAYGVERTDYDTTGGGNHTYVRGQTVVLGIVPLKKSPYAQVKELLSAAAETDETKGGPQLLAWLYWNGDLKVEIQTERLLAAPVEGEGAEKPADGEGAEKKEGEAKDDKKKDDKKKDDKKKDGKKQDGKKAGVEEPAEPVGPTIEKTRAFLPGDRTHPYFLGIVTGRLALFEMKATGPLLLGYLPIQTGAGQTDGAEVVRKDKAKEIAKRGESLRKAEIDPATGFVRIRLAIETRSKTSAEVFVVDVVLKVKGTLAGGWKGYSEPNGTNGK